MMGTRFIPGGRVPEEEKVVAVVRKQLYLKTAIGLRKTLTRALHSCTHSDTDHDWKRSCETDGHQREYHRRRKWVDTNTGSRFRAGHSLVQSGHGIGRDRWLSSGYWRARCWRVWGIWFWGWQWGIRYRFRLRWSGKRLRSPRKQLRREVRPFTGGYCWSRWYVKTP
jgi:hypothetical protein